MLDFDEMPLRREHFQAEMAKASGADLAALTQGTVYDRSADMYGNLFMHVTEARVFTVDVQWNPASGHDARIDHDQAYEGRVAMLVHVPQAKTDYASVWDLFRAWILDRVSEVEADAMAMAFSRPRA
jgi:hypothetical protein